MIRYILIVLFLIITIITVYLLINLPKIDNYIELKEKYDVFASERLEVLELTRKLKRINQMDELVRKSLGSNLNLDKNIQKADSLDTKIFEFQNKISYVDNIPFLPPIQGFVTQRLGEKGVFIRREDTME